VSVYYNEHDPFAAAWLRELMKAGEIPDGFVDTRDIQDVAATDLGAFTQCHFFAGIGGWALALQLAGWPPARPVWTGSCPCQPFSAAGKQVGGRDDRHLWPHWARLIRECRPATIVGEQVESAIAHGWLDAVFDDLESEGYACGAVDLPAASVGAFHRRQRVWFVADHVGAGRHGITSARLHERRTGTGCDEQTERDTDRPCRDDTDGRGADGELADAQRERRCRRESRREDASDAGIAGQAHFWSDAQWLPCRDGKWRPVEPGTFPLAHGVSARVGRLRGYGNAIVPQVAAEVLSAFLEITEDR
jgi:DNA (cytosine-5)-methyltransferase 1